MIEIGVWKDVKRTFFDRDAVIIRLTKADYEALGRIGSYVRTVAKNSIKNKAGSAPPGSPPHTHIDEPLKKGILFGYDRKSLSVVIGPTYWKHNRRYDDIYEMLEYGGYTIRKNRGAHYSARPFMGPAMEASAPFDRFWKDSVTA